MSYPSQREILLLEELYRSERDRQGRSFVSLADAYRRVGRLDEALALVREGTERLPDLASGHLVAGWVHHARGEATAAREAFERVLLLDPENRFALAGVAESGEGVSAIDSASGKAASAVDPEEELPYPVVDIADLAPDSVAVAAGVPEEDRGIGGGDVASAIPVPAVGEPVGRDETDDPDEEGADLDFGDEPVYTRTLAELYVAQGLVNHAIEVYERLLEADPQNEKFRLRVEALKSGEGAAPRPELPGLEPAAERDLAGGKEGAPVGRYFAGLLAWTPGVVPVESLAPDRPGGDRG